MNPFGHNGHSWARTIHHFSEQLAVLLGISLNVALIFVVRQKQDGPLKSYSRVVLMNCIMDIILTSTTWISEVETDAQDGAFFMISNGYLGSILEYKYHLILNWIWCVGVGFSILYQPVPFFHRYVAICKRREPTAKQMIVVFLLPISMCFWNTSWMLAGMTIIDRPEQYAHYLNASIWTDPNGEIPVYTVLHITQFSFWVFTISCALSFPLATSLAIYFYWRIYKTLEEKRRVMTGRTLKMQLQLNKALLSQIIFPFIFGITPVTAIMFFLMFRLRLHTASMFISNAISWIPAINPALTFFLVTAYRRALARLLFRPCTRALGKAGLVNTSLEFTDTTRHQTFTTASRADFSVVSVG